MTKNNEQIIKLKPMEDLNEKIIKEKGNTKCIFYNDDECRNGDRTRDCINCARVEYHSLYSLNWDNQTRLHKEICQLKKENEELNKQLESTKGLAKIRYQCLEAVKELTKNANLPNISLYIDSFLNEEPQKINEVIDEF